TGSETCACAGPALAMTNALAVRISCRTCIPLLVPFQRDSQTCRTLGQTVGTALANQFPAERAGARACERRVRAHYVWERLGLGRWRERCLWVGRGERRDPKANKVGFPHRNGTGPAKRNNCGRG